MARNLPADIADENEAPSRTSRRSSQLSRYEQETANMLKRHGKRSSLIDYITGNTVQRLAGLAHVYNSIDEHTSLPIQTFPSLPKQQKLQSIVKHPKPFSQAKGHTNVFVIEYSYAIIAHC
jgi:hypothetical protein